MLRSLEDYMSERQHHLNESSSARLGRSQKLEILPSPNSKQTQSLGANFLMDAKLWRRGAYILIGAEISTSALFLSYTVWRSNFTNSAYFGRQHLPHIFQKSAYICRQHLPPTFAAHICRIHLPHTFAAYILKIRLHF